MTAARIAVTIYMTSKAAMLILLERPCDDVMAPSRRSVLGAATALALAAVCAVRKRLRKHNNALCSVLKVTVDAQGEQSQITAHLLPLSAKQADDVLLDSEQYQHARVIGIDCEWQPERGRCHHAVSLLQLAPAGDICFLAQLLHMDVVPEQIRYLLQDASIIKVGVGVREDVRRLAQDYGIGVQSVVDLVDVIRATQPSLLRGGSGLAAVSKALLGLDVDKTLQCSDWGNLQLTQQQLRYAALDAWLGLKLAGQLHALLLDQQQQQQQGLAAAAAAGVQAVAEDLAVFLAQFVIMPLPAAAVAAVGGKAPGKQQQQQQQQQQQEGLICGPILPSRKQQQQQQQQSSLIQQQWQQLQQEWQHWQQHNQQQRATLLLQTYVLLHFLQHFPPQQQQQRGRGRSRNKQAKTTQQQQQEWQQQQERRLRQLEQLQRLGQQAAAPTRSIFDRLQNLKPARLPTRKSLQYENCRIFGPDGKALATCGAKKVKWYLDRDLAEIVEETPTIAIRLKFKPKGSGHADDQYYLSDKDNRCVVCGHEGEYLRHSIVPHCYRQHFPPDMKSHLSHDIVLLCVGCHQICNILDQKRMQEIGIQYGAPLEDESKRFRTDRQLAQVRSAGRALAYSATSRKIPPARVQHLQTIIMQHFGVTEWNDSLIQAANDLEPKREEAGWASHGSVVVAAVLAAGQQQQQQGVAGGLDGASDQDQQQQGFADGHGGAHDQDQQQQQQNGLQENVIQAAAVSDLEFADTAAAAAARPCHALGLAGSKPPPPAAAAAAAATYQAESQAVHCVLDHLLEAVMRDVEAAAAAAAGSTAAMKRSVNDTVGNASPHSSNAPAVSAAAVAGGAAVVAFAAVQYLGASTELMQFAAAAAAAACEPAALTCCVHSSSSSSSGGVAIGASSSSSSTGAMSYGMCMALAAVAAAAAVRGDDTLSRLSPPTTTCIAATTSSSSSSAMRTSRQQRPHPSCVSPAAAAAAADHHTGRPALAAAAAEAALGDFIKGWRRHFLAVMQPKYLPPFWSVDARVRNSSGTDMPDPGAEPDLCTV